MMATQTVSSDPLRLLTAAPHRLLFFVGATNVLLAMAWWTYWLVATRWNWPLTQPPVPAGWLHAFIMQYQMLPAFMFGFLLTVFPRWMSQPALSRRHYVPLGVGMLGGQLLTLLGAIGVGDALLLLGYGAALTTIGWLIGVIWLLQLVWRDRGRTWHAVSCASAMCFGLFGLLLYSGFLLSLDPRLMFVVIKVGSFAVLLAIYFTVCHRMIPFFTGAALPGYTAVRPMWALAVMWAGLLLHVWLELRHAYAWLWIPDLSLLALTSWLLWLWWPRGRTMPPLLLVLYLGFLWLPTAFALYTVQSVWFAATSEFILRRGPAHALFIGFFGSLLVAMVTRVTQGHSGRPLILGKVAAFAFLFVQAVAVARIVAEVAPDSLGMQAVAGSGWLLAFAPWVLRSAWIYLTPRVDGAPG